mgnify:CR=1 FL=1
MIELKKVGKVFRTANGDVEALKDIDLTVNDGEIFGIIGLSGAGKSTLVRCINMLERPTSGEVLIDGRDLSKMSRRELLATRKSIGMIFQGFNLLAQRTSLQNVCYPLEISGVSKAKAKQKALELLELVGLSDRAGSYPAQLSGGQKQRVAIARALATDPKVLLCDEATSALDPNTTDSILELLRRINRELGVTVVIITHEMRVIEQICHRVAVIDHSVIVEIGEVKQVFADPQSQIAREIILPKAKSIDHIDGGQKLRIVFDGNSSFEPVVSNMVLDCRTPVNILFADTRDIDGKAFGQMVLQLPDDEGALARITKFLDSRGITYSREGE